jgi:hypothetical protein
MSGFGILMIIFAIMVFLVGLYMYTGHKLSALAWRAAFKGLSIEGYKKVGKYTIIVSIFILIIGIIGIIFNFE